MLVEQGPELEPGLVPELVQVLEPEPELEPGLEPELVPELELVWRKRQR